MSLITCSECGRSVSDQAPWCPGCGAPVSRRAAPSQPIVMTIPKSRSVAVLLAIFLGGIGIHKFYLNRPGSGLLYLLFCWTFIPAILSLIEALLYLLQSDQEFQRKYATEPADPPQLASRSPRNALPTGPRSPEQPKTSGYQPALVLRDVLVIIVIVVVLVAIFGRLPEVPSVFG